MKYLKINETNYFNIINDIYNRLNKKKLQKWIINNDWQDQDIESSIQNFIYDEYLLQIDNDGIIEFDYLDNEIKKIIGNNFVKLYHFTSKKFENSIKNKGLLSGITKTNIYKNSYSGIYLTTRTSGKEIDGYKYHIRNSYNNDVILITVKMFLSEIKPDIDDIDIQSGKTQFISDNIKPNRIIKIENTI